MEYTAYFHIRWKTTRISESYDNLTRATASQLQQFLGPNNGPGIFLRMRQEAVYEGARINWVNSKAYMTKM
jgi:hypothetical protein